MQDPTKYLAKTLKALRKEHGLSLDAAAIKTGIGKAMPGRIKSNHGNAVENRDRVQHVHFLPHRADSGGCRRNLDP